MLIIGREFLKGNLFVRLPTASTRVLYPIDPWNWSGCWMTLLADLTITVPRLLMTVRVIFPSG